MKMSASHSTLLLKALHVCECWAEVQHKHQHPSFSFCMKPESPLSLRHLLPTWKNTFLQMFFLSSRLHRECNVWQWLRFYAGQEVLCAVNSRGSKELLGVWAPNTLLSSLLTTHMSSWELTLLFFLFSFFLSLSSSWLGSSAVLKCCDLMGGNLLVSLYEFARGSESDQDNYIHIFVKITANA